MRSLPRLPRFFFIFLIYAACAHSAQTGSVSGLVLNDADRQPVRKAAVVLTSLAPDRSYAVAITDATGRFTLPDIPAGRYRLVANRSGFLSVNYGATKPQRPGTALNLAVAEQRTGITLHVVPAHTVSGNVVDSEGDPLPGIQISLYIRRMDRGKPRYFPAESTMTNARGHYELGNNVVPGEYWAVAQGRFSQVLRTRPVAIAGETLPAETVAPQFYSHADRIESATPIVVSPDRETPSIDFQLNYSPQVSVHGTVTGLPDHIRNLSVSLEPAFLPSTDRTGGMHVNVDLAHPAFRVDGLIPGSYRMNVQAGARRSVSTVQLVSLDTELNVALQPGTPLKGVLVIEGAGSEDLKNPRISLTPGENQWQQAPLQTAAKDGAFTFPEVPAGIWDIGVNPLPRGAYIKSMQLGQQDVLLEDMVIGPATKGLLKIVISTAAPKVEGTVESAGPVTVIAAPTGSLAQAFSFYSAVQADEKGHFVFNGLNPGAYRFYAFQEVEPDAWQDKAFLLPFEAQSRAADLKEGATETLTLPVIGAARQ